MLVAKWTAARLLFRLHVLGSIVLGLSPLLYVPVTPFVLFAMAKLSSGLGALLYQDSGDSEELLSFNVVVFAAFIVALMAMSVIDWAIVRGSLLPLHISDKSKPATRRFMRAGWLMAGVANLAVGFFWIAVYFALQISHDAD
jgi:hypothetical protein